MKVNLQMETKPLSFVSALVRNVILCCIFGFLLNFFFALDFMTCFFVSLFFSSLWHCLPDTVSNQNIPAEEEHEEEDNVNSELEQLAANEKELKNKIEQTEANAKKMTENLEIMEGQIDTLKTQLKDAEKKIADSVYYERRYHDMKTELEQYRSKFIKEQRAHEHTQSELEKAKALLEEK